MPGIGAYEKEAGIAYIVLSFPIALADVTAAGDVVSNITPGFPGQIIKTWWVQETPVTTGAKLATLNLEIGAVNLVGGTVALTSATCTPLGVVIAGAAITGANSFDKDDTLSVEAASVTAFAEGRGTLYVLVKQKIL